MPRFSIACVHRNAFKTPSRLFCAGQNPIDHEGDFLVADSPLVRWHHHRSPNAGTAINDFFRQISFGFRFASVFFRDVLVRRANHFGIHFMARRAAFAGHQCVWIGFGHARRRSRSLGCRSRSWCGGWCGRRWSRCRRWCRSRFVAAGGQRG